jgi:HEAT repeat protein
MIRFPCPSCKSVIEAREDRVGKKQMCPKCKKAARIPASARPAAPEARPAAPIAAKPLAVATAAAPPVATPVATPFVPKAAAGNARRKVLVYAGVSIGILLFFATFFAIRSIYDPPPPEKITKADPKKHGEEPEELRPVPPDPVKQPKFRNLDELMVALKSKEANTRYQAALEINRQSKVDKAALGPLVAMATDKTDSNQTLQMRKIAIRALGKMGPEAASAIPQLTATLGDANADIRSLSIDALGMIGRPAMAQITDALRSSDGDVQMKAAAILAGFGKDASQSVATLLFFCEQADTDRRSVLCGYIVKIDPANQEALKFLLGCLQDASDNNRRLAWLALKEMGTHAESAKVQLYESYEKENNAEVRKVAEDAYRRITKQE